MEDKKNQEVDVQKNEELEKDEVNGFCKCSTQLKVHCNHDCLDGTAWLSTSN